MSQVDGTTDPVGQASTEGQEPTLSDHFCRYYAALQEGGIPEPVAAGIVADAASAVYGGVFDLKRIA